MTGWCWRVLLWGLMGVAGRAAAHERPGAIYRAFRFPDTAPPVVDGDLRDWAWVGPEYAITTEELTDLVRGASVDEADFSARLLVGWCASNNSLYIGARVGDDVHQVDRPAGTAALRIFQDDALEIFVDADHSGGQFADFVGLSPEEALARNGAQAQHFVLAGPPPDDDFFVNFSAAEWYALSDGPYSEAAYQYDPVGGVITYEVRLVLFDRVDMKAVFLSDEHLLQAGEILGFNVEFDDFDGYSELLDAKWSLSGAYNSFRLADRFADLILVSFEGILPSDIESMSWGRIKAAW